MNIHCGWPGSVHDTRILANYTVFRSGGINSVQSVSGVLVPQVSWQSCLSTAALVVKVPLTRKIFIV